MPIKFACPQCKTVITVDDKMAGKSGKCKCGAAIKIPTPKVPAGAQPATAGRGPAPAKAVATPPRASSLGSVFDDLTDADYNRQSPYQNVYEPPKANTGEAATLKRFDDGTQVTTKPGQLNGLLIFIAILHFLWAMGTMALAAVLLLAAGMLAQAADSIPLLKAGLGVAIAVLSVLTLLFISGGVGLLLKQKWGWFLAAVNFAFMPIDRAFTIIMNLVGGKIELGVLIGSFVGTLIIVALAASVFSADTQRIFRIKKATLPIIAACVGVALALAINGTLLALGAFSAGAVG